MTRALSLTCTALLLVGFTGSAFAKPSIGVLGLEVVDQNGTPTPQDTQAAKELSDGLRARAKAGTGPYTLAPGSDKELIDQKLLNNCDDEKPSCMSAIGNQLGSDILMYGKLEKQGKSYQVTIKVLDVSRKAVLKTSSDMIPVSEASGAPLQGWAKKIYAKLTGESAGGTLVVKVSNADRGTILIDGEQRGTITNGTGTVTGVDGKVRVGVESEGFQRWEQTVTVSGGSVTVPVELERGVSGVSNPDQNPIGPDQPPRGPEGGGGNGKVLWGSVAVGGLLVAGFGTYWLVHNHSIIGDVEKEQCAAGYKQNGCTPASMVDPNFNVAASDARGDKAEKNTWYGGITMGVGLGIAALGIVKVVTSSSKPTEHQAGRGKRVRKERTFVVTPIMSKQGGGATLRVDW